MKYFHWVQQSQWWSLNSPTLTVLPIISDLIGVEVVIGGHKLLGGEVGVDGEDGDGDEEGEDGAEIYPEDDSFLLGEINVGLNVHLRGVLRGLAVLGGLLLDVVILNPFLVLHPNKKYND